MPRNAGAVHGKSNPSLSVRRVTRTVCIGKKPYSELAAFSLDGFCLSNDCLSRGTDLVWTAIKFSRKSTRPFGFNFGNSCSYSSIWAVTHPEIGCRIDSKRIQVRCVTATGIFLNGGDNQTAYTNHDFWRNPETRNLYGRKSAWQLSTCHRVVARCVTSLSAGSVDSILEKPSLRQLEAK